MHRCMHTVCIHTLVFLAFFCFLACAALTLSFTLPCIHTLSVYLNHAYIPTHHHSFLRLLLLKRILVIRGAIRQIILLSTFQTHHPSWFSLCSYVFAHLIIALGRFLCLGLLEKRWIKHYWLASIAPRPGGHSYDARQYADVCSDRSKKDVQFQISN
jgi:hypothetical protein